MKQFTVVSDDLREKLRSPTRERSSPLLLALLNGQTVFIPTGDHNSFSSYYKTAHDNHRRLITRKTTLDGQIGVVAWMEPKR